MDGDPGAMWKYGIDDVTPENNEAQLNVDISALNDYERVAFLAYRFFVCVDTKYGPPYSLQR